MPNKMLIDASHPEETRVVVVRGNRVEEFDFESANRRQLRGNIYLAKVTRVEPSLQACFVDYGGNRHGFLAFSEIHPDYYQIPVADRQALIEEEERAAREAEERRTARHQARHARRDEAISEPAQENGEAAHDAAHEAVHGEDGSHDEHGSIEEVPHDDEAPEEVGAQNENGEHAHESEPAAFNEAAGSDSGGAAEASEVPSEPSLIEMGEEQAREARQDHVEDESVEQVGGGAMEEVPERQHRRHRRYKIQEVIKRRQVLLVQVVKEERGTKGAALTTYLSLAGRYSVLMPNTSRGGGISRKITSSQDRQRLKELVEDLEVPEGMGVILRTAGASRTKPEIKRDFEYLLRLWETVRELTLKSQAPSLVYEEGSLTKRAIRDLYNTDTDEVVVAGRDGYDEAKEFMRMLMPSHEDSVIQYKEPQPIFARYGVEHQLDAMFSPTVQLRSGGYIVINPTEALVSIDVNSGRSTREHHIEDTALKTNMEAAEEIARQLRLRDLAGLIVIDFIDMEEKRNNRNVERKLKECLKNDRARIQVGRISHFGLLEMSRQRIRSSVLESSTDKCPHCGGTGLVRSVSSVTLQLLRSVEEMLLKGATHNLVARTRDDIALYVLNQKRAHLRDLEQRFRIGITVNADASVNGQQPFVIERGEQVHSVEVARAIAVQPETPLPAEIEDDEVEEAFIEDDAQNSERHPETRTAEEDDGTRRRRRRRRRGRRGDAREENGAPQHDLAGDHDHDHEPTHEADDDGNGDSEPTQQAPHNGEAGEEHLAEERRRKRRGRRGGRRNRRENGAEHPSGAEHVDAEANGLHETAGAQETAEGWSEWAQGPQADAIEPPAAAAPVTDEPPYQAPQPATAENVATSEASVQPDVRTEPAPLPAEPAPSPAEASPSRRRSTVREPAPFLAQSRPDAAEFANGVPAPSEPPPAPPETSTQEDANKPRRTGWWAKRVFGKG
jgi:ribonuclease E